MALIDDVERAWSDGVGWDLSEERKIERGNDFPIEIVPYISSSDQWAAYNDSLQYNIEKDLRAFI